MLKRSPALPILALALAAPGWSQTEVGDSVPVDLPLVGFTVDEAACFEEYTGRAVLIEFFAYW